MNRKVLISIVLIISLLLSSACNKQDIKTSEQIFPDSAPEEEGYIQEEKAHSGKQYELFSNILGYDGYSVSIKEHDYFETRYYFAVKDGEHFVIAESFGAQLEGMTSDDSFIDDYVLDIDNDGENELLCNCVFSGDGHFECFVFDRVDDQIVRGRIDKNQLPGLSEEAKEWANGVQVRYNSQFKTIEAAYYNKENEVVAKLDPYACIYTWEDNPWTIDETTLIELNSGPDILLGSAHTVKYSYFDDVLGFKGYIIDDYYPVEGYITRSYCAIEDGKAYYFADTKIFEDKLSDSLVDIDNDGELELITNNIRVASYLAEAVIYKRTGDTVEYGMVKDAACSYFDNNANQFEIHMDSDGDKTIYLDLNKAEITWLGEMEG